MNNFTIPSKEQRKSQVNFFNFMEKERRESQEFMFPEENLLHKRRGSAVVDAHSPTASEDDEFSSFEVTWNGIEEKTRKEKPIFLNFYPQVVYGHRIF